MNSKLLMIAITVTLVLVLGATLGVALAKPTADPQATLLVSGLGATAGSTVGPDGALYVTERSEGQEGRILRVDPQTGDSSVFASGLPAAQIFLGGVVDVVFIGNTAYALVTVVNDPVFGGGSDPAGIYRVDGPNSLTLVADIGTFSSNNVPTNTPIDLTTGVQYALEVFQDGFLVTDGHHNRLLWATLDGDVSELVAFDNTVPTGLEVHSDTVYLAEAGPVPHDAADGKVLAFWPVASTSAEVASGAPLLVDVEHGWGRTLYALSQGTYSGGGAGAPADADTGSLVQVKRDGTLELVTNGLDQPTSLEFIGTTAYVVTLTGEVWKIADVAAPPYVRAHLPVVQRP